MLHRQLSSANVDMDAPPSQPPRIYLDWQKRLDREIERNFPADVLETFTPSQRAVFETLRSRAPTKHSFEYRVSVPTPWKAYYLTIFAGPERRSTERLAHEGQLSLTRRAALTAVVLLLMLSSSALTVWLGLLIAKSAFGFDLTAG